MDFQSEEGGHTCINWSQLDTKTILIAIVFPLYFFDPFLMEGLLYYIAPLEPS